MKGHRGPQSQGTSEPGDLRARGPQSPVLFIVLAWCGKVKTVYYHVGIFPDSLAGQAHSVQKRE